MNSNENINWREMVGAFSSYEGTLVNFCNVVLCQEKVQIKMRNSLSIMHNKLAS